jgi:hypothetical protein
MGFSLGLRALVFQTLSILCHADYLWITWYCIFLLWCHCRLQAIWHCQYTNLATFQLSELQTLTYHLSVDEHQPTLCVYTATILIFDLTIKSLRNPIIVPPHLPIYLITPYLLVIISLLSIRLVRYPRVGDILVKEGLTRPALILLLLWCFVGWIYPLTDIMHLSPSALDWSTQRWWDWSTLRTAHNGGYDNIISFWLHWLG